MSHNRLLELAARVVPGSGPVHIDAATDGSTNASYRVTRDGRIYALRTTGADTRMRDADTISPGHDWERRVLEAAERAGLAPPVEYFSAATGTLVARWVERPTWTSSEARQPRNLLEMAAALRRIHALKITAPLFVMEPRAWIDRYSSALTRHRGQINMELRAKSLEFLSRLTDCGPVHQVLCHGDLHPLNVLAGEPLLFIDWEFAHFADPLWDLAGWSANNDLDFAQACRCLDLYRGVSADHERRRLWLLLWLYDYTCLLWSEMRAAERGPGSSGGIPLRMAQLAARLLACAAEPP